MNHHNLCRNRNILAAALANFALALTVNASINVNLLNTSTDTQLDFHITGTITANSFGNQWETFTPTFYIYKPGLKWVNSSLQAMTSPIDGVDLTAPSIAAATAVYFQGLTFSSENQDAIGVVWQPATGVERSDFAVGQVIDWTFSVRNFGIPAIDLNLFRTSGIPIESQFGTGAAIPEPSTYGLIFGALGLGYVLIRRRRMTK